MTSRDRASATLTHRPPGPADHLIFSAGGTAVLVRREALFRHSVFIRR